MPTIFSRIIEGEIPGTFVWKDDLCVAFMSIAPLRPGHVLVVPIAEVDHWLDLPDSLRTHLIDVSTVIGRAIQEAFHPEKVGLMIAGLEVPHTHIHLVPISSIRDLDFANADASAVRDGLEKAAGSVRESLREMGAAGVAE
jgi:histidine triad (HIT) family protein